LKSEGLTRARVAHTCRGVLASKQEAKLEQLIRQREQYARILHNVTLAYPPELRANALAPIQKALDEITGLIASENEYANRP
jgi:hypothetical protein